MHKNQAAHPASPDDTSLFSQSISKQLQDLCLNVKKYSDADTFFQNGMPPQCQNHHHQNKVKHLGKRRKQYQQNKQKKQCAKRKRQSTIKKHKFLQNRIHDLQTEIHSLRRTCQSCPLCRPSSQQRMILTDSQQLLHQQQLLMRMAGDNNLSQHNRSRQSLQFQTIDFNQSLAYNIQMDDRCWVMIGAMMIVMGSKNMGIDGTINTFKLVNDCVDQVRRQVQKSMERVSLDFYFIKEQIKDSQINNFIQGLDFDPFYSKTQKTGLNLQGLKLENVEQFQLVYDQKIKFSVNYESLIATMQKIKENCWVSI